MRKFTLVRALAAAVLMLVSVTGISAQGDVTLTAIEDSLFGISAIVPEGWQEVSPGIYVRGESAGDMTLIGLQSAPVDAALFLGSMVPQLGLTEAPESIGQVSTAAFDWTLYQVDMSSPQGLNRIDFGLATLNGVTYVTFFQTSEEEYDALHESVFLPILNSVAPLVEELATDPLPYIAEDVTFPGGAEGVTLAGTLTLPEGDGPFPVVVLMTGSGPQDRNESLRPIAAIQPFALIADALTRAGVAVLRYDDRGVGESTGDYASAVIDDFTADGAAAIDYLLTRDEINPEQIGILGHSEGGIYAATLGADNPNVAFVIGMAAPAMNGVDLMVEQNVALSENQGMSPEDVELIRELASNVYAAIIAGDMDAVEQLTREGFGALYDSQTAETQAQMRDRDAFIQSQLDAQMPVYQSPWYLALLESNAGADWARVTIPVLSLYGGKDIQVIAGTNAAALETALNAAGNTDYEIVTFPNANHLFQEAVTGGLEEYGMLEQTFTPDFLPTLIEWVLAHVTPGG